MNPQPKPTIRRPLPDSDLADYAARVADTERTLLAACDEQGIRRTADNRVSERDTATLLDKSESRLRAMRSAGTGPPAFHLGRVSYRLSDIARWIESGKDA